MRVFQERIVLLLFLSFLPEVCSPKNILLLNSYHTGYSWTDEITEGVKKTVLLHDDISLFIEYIDTKRFNSQTYLNDFKDYLLKKYSSSNFDIIITSDNDALDFILKNNINKQWHIPVVFCGISNYYNYDIEKDSLWGIIETDEWFPILKTLGEIHKSNLDKIYFIVENSSTGEIRKKQVSAAVKELEGKVKVVFIENYSYNGLIHKINNISGNNIIYYHGIGVDYYNTPVNPEKLGLDIVKNAKVPVYSSYKNVIGDGAVGGFIGSGTEQGTNSAETAIKLINSKDKSSVNKLIVPSVKFIYDYKAAKKFDIKPENFPTDALVINKPGPLFVEYREEAVSTIIFITILLISIFLLIKNILKRVAAEKYLSESEKKFREFAELLPQTVFECDINGRFIFVNDFALKSFGYTKEEFNKGLNIFEMIIPEEIEKAKENIANNIKSKRIHFELYTGRRKDKTTFPFEIHTSIIFENDKPVSFRGIGIDVTKQKQFEQELIEARKKAEESDKLKSAFLANMSHEIRTPLNSIVGFSYLLAERSLNEEEIKKMAFYIKNSSDHLLMLINDIIDLSKIEAGQLNILIKEMDVNEIMSEIFQFLNKEKSFTEKEDIEIIYRNNSKNEKTLIKSDALRLKQILLNLAANSLKFTEEGHIEIGYTFKDSNIVFYVKDTGIGISNDLRHKIFTRFSKGNNGEHKLYPGFGLGLSISKQLAELLKGRLWFEDNIKKGTVFYLSVPLN